MDEYDSYLFLLLLQATTIELAAEDDHITLYGVAQGRQSYETKFFKATKTLPYMIAYMYEN